ncbi:hypothetical protein [Paracoccus onubensis]|uniref:hypothetical protein n=1 Tax=Paracoccus onubensis TaxID=1675788 RepID=UPI001603E3B5|nr:hypothetical protein [Paracoccus onubensis]
MIYPLQTPGHGFKSRVAGKAGISADLIGCDPGQQRSNGGENLSIWPVFFS